MEILIVIILLGMSSLVLQHNYKETKSRNTLFFAIMTSIAFLVNLIMIFNYV